MKFLTKLLEFLQGPNGEYSSKRLFALSSYIVAIVLAFTGATPEVIAIFMGAATAVFIGSAATHT